MRDKAPKGGNCEELEGAPTNIGAVEAFWPVDLANGVIGLGPRFGQVDAAGTDIDHPAPGGAEAAIGGALGSGMEDRHIGSEILLKPRNHRAGDRRIRIARRGQDHADCRLIMPLRRGKLGQSARGDGQQIGHQITL